MHIRICVLVLVCCAAGIDRCAAADDSPAAEGITVVRDIRYREGPSERWKLDLALPKDGDGKPRPAIVVIHGGGWLEGDKSSFATREAGTPGNIVDFAAPGSSR